MNENKNGHRLGRHFLIVWFSLGRFGVIPVVNENDTVVTDEICFGDNDTLAGLVPNLINADAMVLLTDQDLSLLHL